MSRGESKTKSLFAAERVAGNSTAVFSLREGLKGAAIQVVITEDCLCVSTLVDEDISLEANSYTEVAHGYETGLRGTFAAVIGCATVTPSACINICTDLITEACHGYTTGERLVICCTSCTFPSICGCVVCAATPYFVIVASVSTYQLASSRALALACTAVDICAAGTGCQTFTPDGAIPDGSTAASWIIKIDDDTYKFATSKALAEAGTVDAITVLNSPASLTFTPFCSDCASGTVTISYSVDDITYTVDAGAGLLDTPGVINACVCGLTVVDNADGLHYNSFQVEVDVIDSQWVVDIDVSGKV